MSFLRFAIPFLFDLARFTLIIAALMFVTWLFALGKALGLKQEYIDALENVHFWADYGLYATMALSFFVRILRSIFHGE